MRSLLALLFINAELMMVQNNTERCDFPLCPTVTARSPEVRMKNFTMSKESHLMSAMSSMRPPFPLYKLQALIPSLLLATVKRSDKVP